MMEIKPEDMRIGLVYHYVGVTYRGDRLVSKFFTTKESRDIFINEHQEEWPYTCSIARFRVGVERSQKKFVSV